MLISEKSMYFCKHEDINLALECSIPVDPASVRYSVGPWVNIFKLEYLRN